MIEREKTRIAREFSMKMAEKTRIRDLKREEIIQKLRDYSEQKVIEELEKEKERKDILIERSRIRAEEIMNRVKARQEERKTLQLQTAKETLRVRQKVPLFKKKENQFKNEMEALYNIRTRGRRLNTMENEFSFEKSIVLERNIPKLQDKLSKSVSPSKSQILNISKGRDISSQRFNRTDRNEISTLFIIPKDDRKILNFDPYTYKPTNFAKLKFRHVKPKNKNRIRIQ